MVVVLLRTGSVTMSATVMPLNCTLMLLCGALRIRYIRLSSWQGRASMMTISAGRSRERMMVDG